MSPPPGWRVEGGALHHEPLLARKESATFTCTHDGRCHIIFTNLGNVTDAQGFEVMIYSPDAHPEKIIIRVGRGSELSGKNFAAEFPFYPGGRGWWHFLVQFREDAPAFNAEFKGSPDTVAIEIPGGKGWIGINNPRLLSSVPWDRTADPSMPYLLTNTPKNGYLREWYNVHRIVPPVTAGALTGTEKKSLAELTTRYDSWLLGGTVPAGWVAEAIESSAAAALQRAQARVTAFALKRTNDFIVSAPGTFPTIAEVITPMLPLALHYRRTGDAKTLADILLLLDYAHEQGLDAVSLADGSLQGMRTALLLINPYVHTVGLLRRELATSGRLERERRTLVWFSRLNEIYRDRYLDFNADVVRAEMLHRLVTILVMDDTPAKTAALRRFTAWVAHTLTPFANLQGVIKPDFTPFHHAGVFLCAYGPDALSIQAVTACLLRGTPWEIPAAQRETLRQAALTLRFAHQFYSAPVSGRGRWPAETDSLAENLALYAYCADMDPNDTVMTAAFKRLLRDDSRDQIAKALRVNATGDDILYTVTRSFPALVERLRARSVAAEPDPVGFRVLPYAGMAIHRRADWMVAVQGISAYVWDYESQLHYPDSTLPDYRNAYGRYLRYGTLELFTAGNPVSATASGFTLKHGWDWNRWPGATTVHLPLEELRVPDWYKLRRFSDETFLGGAALRGVHGAYGYRLHDCTFDKEFRARKSYFFFDQLIVCLGSGIQSSTPGRETETTLFQTGLTNRSAPIWVNAARPLADFPYERTFDNGSAWLIDAAGNGYLVSDARTLTVRRGEQQSRTAEDEKSEGDYATAWFRHGIAPHDASYHYAIVVRATPEEMPATAARPPYEVLRHDNAAHVVRHSGLGITAFVLFEPASAWVADTLKSDTPAVILLERRPKTLRLAVANPDVNFPASEIEDLTHEQSVPTQITLTLRGRWRLANSVATVRLTDTGGETTLEVTCHDGATTEFDLLQ